jgi:hypothetical protein
MWSVYQFILCNLLSGLALDGLLYNRINNNFEKTKVLVLMDGWVDIWMDG